VWFTEIESPIGPLRLAGDVAGLRQIDFLGAAEPRPRPPDWVEDGAALAGAVQELRAYFAGRLRDFTLKLAPHGTAFQQGVWRRLCEIPYGQTTSYGELAARIGNPSASRAVGLANGRNPIPIVIPCHRVIGRNGTLVGYGGGLAIKERLLALERGH
jgi:methylated-DNA-[protein]-cysteine S-methyltransferase